MHTYIHTRLPTWNRPLNLPDLARFLRSIKNLVIRSPRKFGDRAENHFRVLEWNELGGVPGEHRCWFDAGRMIARSDLDG